VTGDRFCPYLIPDTGYLAFSWIDGTDRTDGTDFLKVNDEDLGG
jgi:hypothetical protein